MAFPASPSDNQVHKETNGRSYVYDSTLGTWDRVSSADALSSESGGGSIGTVSHGTLEDSVNFPTFGQVHEVQIIWAADYGVGNTTTYLVAGKQSRINVTLLNANTKIFWTLSLGDAYANDANVADFFMCAKVGQDSLWQTPHDHAESAFVRSRTIGAGLVHSISGGGTMSLTNVAGAIWNFGPGFHRHSGSGTYFSNYQGADGRGTFTIQEIS